MVAAITRSSSLPLRYGRTILDALLAWLHQRGIDYIQLHASPGGQPLYTGFVPARYPTIELVPHLDGGAESSR